MMESLQLLIARFFTSRIGRETLGSMGLKFSSVSLTFLSSVLLARVLGPEDFGVYAYVYALILLLSVPSEFGLPTLVVRETARGMARKEYSSVQGVWRWSTRMTGIISFTLVALTGVFIFFFQGTFSNKRLETFLWALALVPLIALGNFRGAALRGLQRIVAGQLPEFLVRPGIFVLVLASSIWLRAKALSAPNAMAMYVAASALAFGFGAFLLWKTTPPEVRQAAPRIDNRAWLLSALPLAFVGGMQLVNQQASILLQGFYLSDSEIGVFRVATQVSQLASFGLLAINMVVAPRFAILYAQNNMRKLQRLVTRSTQIILAFSLMVTVGFILLGKPFLHLLFGSPYTTAYMPLVILLGGQLVNSGVGSVGVLLNMTYNERETAKALTISAILNIVFNLLLIPIFGIIGSAVATVISLTSWNLLLWSAVRKRIGINSLAIGKPRN